MRTLWAAIAGFELVIISSLIVWPEIAVWLNGKAWGWIVWLKNRPWESKIHQTFWWPEDEAEFRRKNKL